MCPERLVEGVSANRLSEQVAQSIRKHEHDLAAINKKIHDNPEIRYQEIHAHDGICELMESLGYSVVRHAYGISTSFQVESGSGGRVVVFNAEYDALPGIGHACGHNLIATSSIASFVATAEAIRANGIEGRVRLLGTPAEESGGGKIQLIRAGAYKEVDACIMIHPGPASAGLTSGTGNEKAIDGVAATSSLARKKVTVTFTGKNAHAGLNPWDGANALDAVVASYVNISLLRQQIPPTARIHGVVRKGGLEPNMIPDEASLEYFARDANATTLESIARKIDACFKAGAQATGCSLHCTWDENSDYKDLRPNMTIARLFTQHMTRFGRAYLEDGRHLPNGASTDMGNVCYEVPSFHGVFSVGPEVEGANPHNPEFAVAAGTRSAFLLALDAAKGMAMTGYDILSKEDLAAEAWKEFRQEFRHH